MEMTQKMEVNAIDISKRIVKFRVRLKSIVRKIVKTSKNVVSLPIFIGLIMRCLFNTRTTVQPVMIIISLPTTRIVNQRGIDRINAG